MPIYTGRDIHIEEARRVIADQIRIERDHAMAMDVFSSSALGIRGEIINGRVRTTGILEPEKPSKPKEKTIRQKLQAEVNSWLNDIK